MKIEIHRHDTEYPLVDVHVDITTDVDSPDLVEVLSKNRITLLGRWRPNTKDGHILSVMAPALLEDEHVKPPKKRRGPYKKPLL